LPSAQVSTQDLAAQLGPGDRPVLGDSNAAVLVINGPGRVLRDNGRAIAERGVDAGDARSGTTCGLRSTAPIELTSFVGSVSKTPWTRSCPGAAESRRRGRRTGGLLPLVLVGALGVGAYALTRRRKTAKAGRQTLDDLRADVESLYGRLGSDVETLAPGDDAIARQALSDAAERYNATGR
jgi:hypothetical protein